MRISDWSSDVCSSDLVALYHIQPGRHSSAANYFPAYRDFISMVLINTRFLGEPYIDIKHRAVTEYAVIEYRFSDWSGVQNRARLYAAKGLGKYDSQNLDRKSPRLNSSH